MKYFKNPVFVKEAKEAVLCTEIVSRSLKESTKDIKTMTLELTELFHLCHRSYHLLQPL